MSEKDQRKRVVAALRDLHAIAVENPARVGTPDVNFADGWIELKWLRKWPEKPETPVRFPHFTVQQKAWIMQRQAARGNVWVLVQCRTEWLLFDGKTACKVLGQVNKATMIEHCRQYWPNGLDRKELIACLTQLSF
jgi:hypothetical protein